MFFVFSESTSEEASIARLNLVNRLFYSRKSVVPLVVSPMGFSHSAGLRRFFWLLLFFSLRITRRMYGKDVADPVSGWFYERYSEN